MSDEGSKTPLQIFGSNLTVAAWTRIITLVLSGCAIIAVTPATILISRLVRQLDENTESSSVITDKLHEISKVQAVTAIIIESTARRVDGLEMRERMR